MESTMILIEVTKLRILLTISVLLLSVIITIMLIKLAVCLINRAEKETTEQIADFLKTSNESK